MHGRNDHLGATMPDKRFTFTGQGRIEDDEEEESKTPGRPNAWWAEHKGDVQDAAAAAATYDGAVTATRQGTHGGEKNVTTATGSINYCWCGLPYGHDWPGKDQGRKHPKEMSDMTATGATSQQRIERRQLRAYNDDIVDVITEAVNGYHARYRMQKNGIVLFPPDGTQGITLNARASARQVKNARLWFLRHCVGVNEAGDATNPLVADPEVLREDHDIRVDQMVKENRAEGREALEKLKQQETPSSLSEPEPPEPEPEHVEPWVPYVGSDGEESEFYETDGTIIRCHVCLGTDSAYETDNARGLGGHIRTRHRDTTNLHSPEARAKATESKRLNRLTAEVRESIERMGKAIGYAAPVDTRQIEALQAENAVLRKRAEDAEAKLALIREASGL
jgi:hypothetical protein